MNNKNGKDLSTFSDVANNVESSGMFGRYADSEYVAGEMSNLIRIALTHSADLVHDIEEDSPEARFLESKFGISYPLPRLDELPAKVVEPAPIKNTIMHSFNAAAMDRSTVSSDVQNAVDGLAEQSAVVQKIINHEYDDFGQILDSMFPGWNAEQDPNVTLDHA